MAVSQDSAGSLRFQVFALAVCSIGIAFLVMQILRATGGSLFYALDDPYIHLALAENLRGGHYGINPGETASPSSSMLYPFLLAATLMVGFGTYGPLVLSVVGALGSAWVLSGMVWRAFEGTREAAKPAPWLLYGVMPLLLVAVNGYALALTGMEHTLHVLASLLILRGLTQLTREGGPDIWQITCSGLKNEFPQKLLSLFDRLNRWLYGVKSPLNFLTKRRSMKIIPRIPKGFDDLRSLNKSGVGRVMLDVDGKPEKISVLTAEGQEIEFPERTDL